MFETTNEYTVANDEGSMRTTRVSEQLHWVSSASRGETIKCTYMFGTSKSLRNTKDCIKASQTLMGIQPTALKMTTPITTTPTIRVNLNHLLSGSPRCWVS